MTTLSVTEVRNALRCPRIFALGRMKNDAVAFPIGSSCLGASFHRLVHRFGETVDAAPPGFASLEPGAPLDEVDAALRAWLVGLLIDELQADAALVTMPGEVDDLAQALRELARHLAARLRRFSEKPSAALLKVVRGSERPLESSVGESILVRGTLDAMYGEPDGSLEVVEYKLTDEANDFVDRAQVALYGYMLERATGVAAKPVILRFMPMLRETSLSPVEARDMIDRIILPLVRDMARWA
jgi:DNA segregation ATPase FtsK/SpoIIIE, S-DNA-T family